PGNQGGSHGGAAVRVTLLKSRAAARDPYCYEELEGMRVVQRWDSCAERFVKLIWTPRFASAFQREAPASPKSPAIPLIAWIQKAMCSSRSTPISAAPLMMSSRFTLRANALSFIFLRTDLASTSANDLLGFTSALAVMNPASSSQANNAFSILLSRFTPLYSA